MFDRQVITSILQAAPPLERADHAFAFSDEDRLRTIEWIYEIAERVQGAPNLLNHERRMSYACPDLQSRRWKAWTLSSIDFLKTLPENEPLKEALNKMDLVLSGPGATARTHYEFWLQIDVIRG